jgi:hypothetical protein
MDLKPLVGDIQSSLHACNAGPDNQDFGNHFSDFACSHWFHLSDPQLLQIPKLEVV